MKNSWNRRVRVTMPALLVALVGLGAACAPTPEEPAGCDGNVLVIGGYPASALVPGWYSSDTRETGNVTTSDEFGAPDGLGCGAAKLTTGEARFASGQTSGPLQDKAQLFSYEQAGTALAAVEDISYWAYRSSASTGGAAPTLALNVQITGASVPGNFATLVYEPYNQSGGQGAIVNDTWQQWDATASTPGDGVWWTTKIPSGPGSQGQPVAWDTIQGTFPGAAVAGYGFNLGSNNPHQIVAGDGLQFGSILTDF